MATITADLPQPREAMSPGFAVFNGHVNNADQRARAFMARRCPTYLARVEALEREGDGIMYLFRVCGLNWGSPAARRYISLVTQYVNEDATPSLYPLSHPGRG